MVVRLLILLVVFFSVPVFATTVASEDGFWNGFLHTIFGIDHLLVALCVGMLCAMISSRVVCMVPMAFLFFLALGGLAGMLHISLPFVSFGVAASVVAIGLLIALNRQWPLSFTMAFVGLLAVFHGYAHGAEMPDMEHYLAYGIGFLAGTVLMQLIGIFVGLGLNQLDNQSRLLRYTGGAVAAFGSYLVLGLII
ncbi:hypothetical protein HR45_07730 [Shewanella mangrovi]|uniref:Urease accessory protein UreJ n=1 Tax=Shewanella mangrovi TaxID=1515746 RepID=A0A094JZ78_9GAMM|nr:HupE/UreJ family protein [Shewanella mangrovi]KFZ37741.1 hypothetical protein HR45_07730 [Shewanella mangrovi]